MGQLSSPYVRRRLEKLIATGSVPNNGKFFARRPILHQQLRSAIGEMQGHVRVTTSRKPLSHGAELNKAHAGHKVAYTLGPDARDRVCAIQSLRPRRAYPALTPFARSPPASRLGTLSSIVQPLSLLAPELVLFA